MAADLSVRFGNLKFSSVQRRLSIIGSVKRFCASLHFVLWYWRWRKRKWMREWQQCVNEIWIHRHGGESVPESSVDVSSQI